MCSTYLDVTFVRVKTPEFWAPIRIFRSLQIIFSNNIVYFILYYKYIFYYAVVTLYLMYYLLINFLFCLFAYLFFLL